MHASAPRSSPTRRRVFQVAFPLALALAAVSSAVATAEPDPEIDSRSQLQAPTAFADEKPRPVQNWGAGDGRSYWIPALDIVAFDTLLNLFNRRFSGIDDYDSDLDSIEENLTGNWVFDADPFDINQFGHPYQGSMYHGFARSAGLGYWEASLYTILGSAAWEVAGEITRPSLNDQLTTGFGGSFLGEPLFRLSSLLLESGDGEPELWREVGAALISPATGFNRLAFGDRFDGVFRSHDPATYTHVTLGVNLNSSVRSNANVNADPEGRDIPQSYRTGEAAADFTIAYGLPGKPGYTYDRPFDYFHLQFTAVTSNAIENIMTRGLLVGRAYALGNATRGVWGLYGTYDYISPQIFRISTTTGSLGTTAQWWATRDVALQGTVLAGLGYGSGGTTRGVGPRDYHAGLTAQGLLALRLILGDRVSLDLTARDYHVTDIASDESGGQENIVRTDAGLTVRVAGLHGLAIKYVTSTRDAKYSGFRDTHQRVGAFQLGYAYLGQIRSGAVDWRPPSEGGP